MGPAFKTKEGFLRVRSGPYSSGWIFAAFASNPTANPNLLLAWDLGLSPADITSFDVSSGSPVQTTTAHESSLGNLTDVALNPDFLTQASRSWPPPRRPRC